MDHQGIYDENMLGLIEGTDDAPDERLCKIHDTVRMLDLPSQGDKMVQTVRLVSVVKGWEVWCINEW